MTLNDIHNILFNAHILYSVALGIWAALTAANNRSISGNYWGAVVVSALLALVVTVVGIIMTLQGLRPGRIVTYYLYMSWLVIIMPGLFTLLRGRDDRTAAFSFALLAFFNAATSISMLQRAILGPWTT
jgi:hypothetical protein